MRRFPSPIRFRPRAVTAAVLATLAADVGCHHHTVARQYDEGPPPPVVTTAAPYTPAKPLPPQAGDLPPAYADPALVRQQVPEEPRYAQAYQSIGKPKLVVFVNRTVTGELVPVNPNIVVRNGGLPPGEDRAATYLRAGQYDEAQARSIDYELVENLLTEDLSADGKVTVIAPMSARQRLSDEDVREIQAGRPQMLGEVATKLAADVLVQVTARPSQQTDAGLGIRLVAEALNTHGGQAIAFAAVDVPAPLSRGRLNEYVRFVSRKLMDGMSQSWEDMGTAAPATQGPVSVTPSPTPFVPPTPAPVLMPPTLAPPVVIPPVVVPSAATPPSRSTTPAMVPATPTGKPGDLPPPP